MKRATQTPEQAAHAQAATESASLGKTRFVVHVFDGGVEVFDARQCSVWSEFVRIEACYLAGARIATAAAGATA